MRVLWGVSCLMMVMALLGIATGRHVKAVQGSAVPIEMPIPTSAPRESAASGGQIAPQTLQRKVANDVNHLMQHAPSRLREADAP